MVGTCNMIGWFVPTNKDDHLVCSGTHPYLIVSIILVLLMMISSNIPNKMDDSNEEGIKNWEVNGCVRWKRGRWGWQRLHGDQEPVNKWFRNPPIESGGMLPPASRRPNGVNCKGVGGTSGVGSFGAFCLAPSKWWTASLEPMLGFLFCFFLNVSSFSLYLILEGQTNDGGRRGGTKNDLCARLMEALHLGEFLRNFIEVYLHLGYYPLFFFPGGNLGIGYGV